MRLRRTERTDAPEEADVHSDDLVKTRTSSGSNSAACHISTLDGVRALSSLSLVLFHTILITSAHIPPNNPHWTTFQRNILALGGGGGQVDVLLTISGFLLGMRELRRCVIMHTLILSLRNCFHWTNHDVHIDLQENPPELLLQAYSKIYVFS